MNLTPLEALCNICNVKINFIEPSNEHVAPNSPDLNPVDSAVWVAL